MGWYTKEGLNYKNRKCGETYLGGSLGYVCTVSCMY